MDARGIGGADFAVGVIPMDTDEYLKVRLEAEIAWYDKKSGTNKRWNNNCRIAEIVCAAIIPLLAGYAKDGTPYVSIGIGIFGVIVAACAGISALLKFQEQWIKYRTTAESLKKEKYLFLTKVEPYDVEDPRPVLVQRVETLVSQENTNWAQYMMKPGKAEGHG
jgi:hypothetical protein